MGLLIGIADFIMHLDTHLTSLIQQWGPWTYLLLFLIIFAETGFVVTPFLPGDSLLFVVGAIAATGSLDLTGVVVLLCAAAIGGNTINYIIGKMLSKRITDTTSIKFIKKAHLEKTHAFFEKYGGKTIIITRFVPIVRTIAPFMAGVGAMTFRRFQVYNVVGGLLWICSFVFAGYFFGNMPLVKHNFTLVVFAIIIISLLPALIEYFRHRSEQKNPKK